MDLVLVMVTSKLLMLTVTAIWTYCPFQTSISMMAMAENSK